MAKISKIGPYSAYAIAVANGFSGTEQEWLASLVGSQGPQGASVTGAKIDASQHLIITVHDPETGGDTEIDAGEIGTAEAVQAVQQAIQQAGQSAVSAVESAGSTQQNAVTSAGTQAVSAIGSARQTAVQQVQQAGQESIASAQQEAEKAAASATAAAGSATQAAASATAAQQSQNAAAQSATLAGDSATAAKSSQDAAAASATQAAGSASDAAASAEEAKQAAANSGLPQPTAEDVGKVPTVNDAGTGYVLGEAQVDAYTKAESDARYAPIAAAIRPTVSGNPATLENSVEWPLQGLTVYGKSTQDGTPSPDSPVPIVSAGESGSITVTVSGGADQSQQLVANTPNGLPGIPVNSGGNYTDADGQQWICDEIDFARGVYVQRVGTHLIRRSLSISNSRQRNPDYFGCENGLGSDGKGYDKSLMSDKSIFSGIDANINGAEITIVPSNGVMVFGLEKSVVSEETVEAVTNYLSENPITILYAFKEPIETPLSAEELAAYAALRTYDGTTVVATDAPVAGLSARYVADGAAYIDSKIQSAVTQAVAAAVSLTGGAQ